MIIKLRNSTDKSVIKLSGKIRPSVGKGDLLHSAVNNANLYVLFTLTQLMASSKTRISENVVVFIGSGVSRGFWRWGFNPPPRNSEDIVGVLDRMSKKNWHLDFLL